MTAPDRIAEAAAAAEAMARFIAPAFEVARSDYTAKLTKLYADLDDAKVERARSKLALALRVLNEVEQQIQAIIMSGNVALHDQRHADRIANLPTHQRMGIALS